MKNRRVDRMIAMVPRQDWVRVRISTCGSGTFAELVFRGTEFTNTSQALSSGVPRSLERL